MEKAIGIILAGGIGSRFGGETPKQYHLINGKELIWYSIEAFKHSKNIYDFIVVLDKEQYDSHRIEKKYRVKTVLGGETRNHSLKNALDYIKENFPECNKVIENDAARPLTTSELIDKYICLLDEYDYVQTAAKIVDSLGCYNKRNVSREDYFLIQAPDAYRFKMLYECFDPDFPNTHPAVQLPETSKGFSCFDFGNNFKVTYSQDIEIVEVLIKRNNNC